MRVLALVTDAYGSSGGIARLTCEAIEAFAEEETVSRVHVICRKWEAPPVQPPGFKIIVSSPIFSRGRFALKALAAGLLESPGVVYCNHVFLAPIAAIVAVLSRSKFVLHVHGFEVWGSINFIRRFAMRLADIVLCVSADTRNRVLAVGVSDRKAIVLHNPVGVRFSPPKSILAREHARRKYGLVNEFAILSVGRLDGARQHKGHDLVLKSLRKVDARDVIYLIAGAGTDRERIENLANKLGMTGQLRMLGFVPDEDLPDLYRAADLFALPSTGEGFGIVYLEAMACGTPAIGLRVGGASEALGGCSLGHSVDAASFTEMLGQLINRGPVRDQEAAAEVQRRFGSSFFRSRLRSLALHSYNPGVPASDAALGRK